MAQGLFASDPAGVDRARRADASLDHESPLKDLFEDQLAAADLVIVNKIDEIDARELERVKAQIAAHVPPEVKIVTAVHGELSPEVVLGLGRASEASIDLRPTHHDAHHAEGRDHDHDLFDSLVLDLPELERDALIRGLQALARHHTVYRAKGFASVPGKPMRLVIQGVGKRIDSYFDRAWTPSEARATRLVVIGLDLEREALLRTLLDAAAA